MTLWEAILMGIIQGITEFLPVSSSGHLAIFKNLFQVNTDTGILYDILLHLGTLIAVCVVYWKDIWRMIVEGVGLIIDACHNLIIFFKKIITHQEELRYRKVVRNGYRKFDMLVIMATIPTAVIGFVAQDLVEAASEILLIPGIGLLITAVLLFVADRLPGGKKTPKDVSYTNGFGIGICQGIATLPGISRSGTTIAACLISGLDRNFAVKYSFIMSIPAILGATILKLGDIGSVSVAPVEIVYYIIGMLIAAVIGYICIKTLLLVVRKKKFVYFSIYCLIIGIVSIVGYFIMA